MVKRIDRYDVQKNTPATLEVKSNLFNTIIREIRIILINGSNSIYCGCANFSEPLGPPHKSRRQGADKSKLRAVNP
jgi:hypothetical protein